VVEKGRGYSPAEVRSKLPIGDIPVDAIFSPVRRTNYVVEPARVGQMTDFDRLVIEVLTDGSIAPQDALRQSAQILLRHFNLVATFGEAPAETEEIQREGGIPSRVYETPIEDLGLTVRAYNCLKRAGITKVGEVLERLEKGEEEILAVRNFGRKSLDELREKLVAKGFLSPDAAAVSAGSSAGAPSDDESAEDLDDVDESDMDDLADLDEADSEDWDENADHDAMEGEEYLEDLETE